MQTQVDLLIIGGGINGAGIARDAAGRGLSVALCEQGDLAGATSSASSKLIHGGLRYLETGQFRLVHESLAERETLLSIAPHLMCPTRFVIPHTPQLRPAWMMRLGLIFYDFLGGRLCTSCGLRSLPAAQTVDLTSSPYGQALQADYRTGFVYSDVQTDDARLVILNLRDAAERGASILPRTRLISARREGDLWCATLLDTITGRMKDYHARALVNAAGPWVASLFDRLPTGQRKYGIRLVKGSHIVVPRLYDGKHAYTLQHTDRRIIFLLPWEQNFTLIGTTDIELSNPAEPAQISAEEVAYLCAAVNRYTQQQVQPGDVVWQFSGVRALFDDGKDNAGIASTLSRDYRLQLDDVAGKAPLLSVFGGKLTTYRRLAERAMEKLQPWLPISGNAEPAIGRPWTAHSALPGGDCPLADAISQLQARHPNLPLAWLEQIARRHGSRTLRLLADVRETKDLGLDFGGGLYEIEVTHFIAHEWAQEADDILWRRTKAGLHMTPEQRACFADWFNSCNLP
jgi:glycerol-3-phosphate dehydrogenase